MKRLVKGLASTRKGARQGFATVLTEILSEFACLSPEKVLKLIAKNLEVTGSAKSWVRHWSYHITKRVLKSRLNKNALSSVESRLFVDKIRSEEVNRARAFVTREGGRERSAYKRAWDARRLA